MKISYIQKNQVIQTLLPIARMDHRSRSVQEERNWLTSVLYAVTKNPVSPLKDEFQTLLDDMIKNHPTEKLYQEFRIKVINRAKEILRPLVKDEIDKLNNEKKSILNRLNGIEDRLKIIDI